MYLRTPKRYSGKDERRRLINLKWVWLYLMAPVVLIGAVLAWDYRQPISGWICDQVCNRISVSLPQINAPTPTATIVVQNAVNSYVQDLQSGNLENALITLKALNDSEPNNVQLHALTAELIVLRTYIADDTELDLGTTKARMTLALNAAQAAINANPEAADGWIEEALALDWGYQYQEALPYALHARELDDKNPMMLAVLAGIYHDLGRDSQAGPLADSAVDAAKASKPLNQSALAYAYYVKGLVSPQDSTKLWEAAWNVGATFKYDPSDPEDYVPVGYIVWALGAKYLNNNQVDLAVKRYTDAINIDKQDPFIYYLLGRANLKLGQNDTAQKEFEKCADLDSTNLKCLRNLARLSFGHSNWLKTIDYLKTVIDENSNISDDYYMLGISYIRANNQCVDAIPVLQKGLTFATDSSDQPRFVEALNTCNAGPAAPLGTPAGTESATLAATEAVAVPAITTTPLPPPPK